LLPLYQQYAALIYGWCLRYLGTAERAEDAGAEIFPILLSKAAEHEVTNFGSWLQTLVRNHCLMQLRREKRDPLQLSEGPLMQMEGLGHQGGVEDRTDTRPLYRCMKQLREEQRQCIRLFYLQAGESYRSIAEQLNLSVGQVRSHIQNGRRNLKICLEETSAQNDPFVH
jgi:RNA polymerase sigma-70 factor (ECF subfamily)